MRILTILTLLTMLTGCATSNAPLWTNKNGTLRRAIVVGLTSVAPSYYQGWNGDCPGCDTDSAIMAMLCKEQGLETQLFQNEQATRKAVISAAKTAYTEMRAGDLLLIFISGHGGQVKDTNGDEEDGQDETLCLYDGQLSDDTLYELWQTVPTGVRILYITDTCNSGTNYRYKPRNYKKTIPRAFGGVLIHYGGCADGESSYGDASGGRFTTALIDAWSESQTYFTWYSDAFGKMPISQQPIYAEYGDAMLLDDFRTMKALK